MLGPLRGSSYSPHLLHSPAARVRILVRDGREAYAARVPLHERFYVYRDHRGVLRTDHELRLYRALVLRLHYRMEQA